jgi:serine kinase of HPr protein (carbohydrate metabolism regulator)
MIRHAGLIARREDGLWRGVLLEGSTGSGKSDLMLRALDLGWVLVADDRVRLWASGGRLFGRAPDTLAGLMELRGVGVLAMAALPFAEVVLLARCVETARIARIPEPETEILAGLTIPCVRVTAVEASAPAKLAHALTRVGLPAQRAYQARGAGGDHPVAGGGPVSSLE